MYTHSVLVSTLLLGLTPILLTPVVSTLWDMGISKTAQTTGEQIVLLCRVDMLVTGKFGFVIFISLPVFKLKLYTYIRAPSGGQQPAHR